MRGAVVVPGRSRRDRAVRARILTDGRGAVAIEFLFAFFPVFLVFLAICQLSLQGAAALMVQHSAARAARAAVVILEDDPKYYGGAPRGSLSWGKGKDPTQDLFDRLGLRVKAEAASGRRKANLGSLVALVFGKERQNGARMVAIRYAAVAPLLLLAPTSARDEMATLGRAISSSSLEGAVRYTRAATGVSLRVGESEPGHIPREADVTARVVYLHSCAVPFVRLLLCASLEELSEGPLAEQLTAANVSELREIAGRGARFFPVVAEMTMPNQGASYVEGES